MVHFHERKNPLNISMTKVHAHTTLNSFVKNVTLDRNFKLI